MRRAAVEMLEGRRMFSGYTATVLATPAGAFSSQAYDLNASGQAVGTAWIGQFDGWNPQGDRALLWDDGVMIDLGSLGGRHSSAEAINDRGQVVGWTTRPDNSGHGFLINPEDTDGNGAPDRWSRDANGDGANDLMVELPMPGASDINNTGQVIDRDSIWTPVTPNGTTGTRVDLGFLAGASPYRGARAINDAGQVVGAALIDDVRHAVLWQGGVMTSLGEGIALAINASGQIAGYLDNNPSYGFLWSPTRPNGTDGTFTAVSGLFGGTPGAYAVTTALDNAGHIVGDSGIVTSGDDGGGGAEQRATLWAGGTPQDLNALIVPAPNGAWLEHADAVNDAGQIVGHTAGPFLGTPPWQAVLLTPINTLPKVQQVYVSGSAWGGEFKQFLADRGLGSAQYGFAVAAGDQLNELPWVNLDQVSVTFSSGVRVDQDDLRVLGVNVPSYAVSGFDYDAGGRTATWTLARGLINDRVVLDLDGDAGGVADPQGRLLDGEWSDGADAYPSGDGAAGGDFRFRINVLPGDVTRSGSVLADDFSELKRRFFRSTAGPGAGDAGYSAFHDVNGSGAILADDFSEVKKRFFQTLPGREAVAASSAFGALIDEPTWVRPADDLLA